MPALLPTGNAADFRVKTSLHSISYAGFWRGQAFLSVDDFIDKAQSLGFDGIALMAKRPHASPLDYSEQERTRLRKRIEQSGLKLVCLAGYSDFLAGIDKPGIPHVEIQASYIGELARFAHELGTDIIRIFTGYERPGISYEQQYSTVLEGLKLAGEQAAEWDVTVAVQNHHDVGLHHDVMEWMLREVDHPNVKAAWDAWSPALEGLEPGELRASILTMKPNIIHTALADYVRMPRFQYQIPLTNYVEKTPYLRAVPMGEGFIDYGTFLQTLREIGYQGYLTYEMCANLKGGGSVENLDLAAKQFLKYVKKFDG
jgi:sugar phosphate isomerase/epimerase